MKIRVEPPLNSEPVDWKKRTKEPNERGLMLGATAVYREGTRFWARGDYEHAHGNIDTNIKRLVEITQSEHLTYAAKGYWNDEIYKGTGRIDWEDATRLHDTNHFVEVNPKLPIEVH